MKYPPSFEKTPPKKWDEATKAPEAEKRSASSGGSWILSVVILVIFFFLIFAYDYHSNKKYEKMQDRIDTTVRNLEDKVASGKEFEEKLRQEAVMAKAESQTYQQEVKNLTKLLDEKSKIQSAQLEENIRLQAEIKALKEAGVSPRRPAPAPAPVKIFDAESRIVSAAQKSCLAKYKEAIIKSCQQAVKDTQSLSKVNITQNGKTRLNYQCVGTSETHVLQFGPEEIVQKCL